MAQVSSSLGGDGRQLEVVLMEVVDVSMPLDEAFIVEAVVLAKRVLIEVGDATFLSKGVPSMVC